MNIFKKIFSGNQETSEHIKLNVKGQQVDLNPKDFNPYTFKSTAKLSKSTDMFSTKTRVRMWGYMGAFVIYCFLLSKLLKYRLKADDLEIMEKEVKNEFEIKRRIKEFNKEI